MRTVIFHFHLFKNAGTSLDAAFKENFSEDNQEWVTKEFPPQPGANREQVKQWIIENPQAKCFSSHTAIFPLPEIEGLTIIPVMFIRNPIDRIASAYSFESKQVSTSFGAVLAKNTDLAGYVDVRLSLHHDRQCRNFHSARLSTMFPESLGDELTRSLKALEAIDCLGLVECYNESLVKIEQNLKEVGFEDISLVPLEKNVSRDVKVSLEEKLTSIRERLGERVSEALEEANKIDFEVYLKCRERYEEA